MAYIPDIVDYKPFWIQVGTNPIARDTREWGLVAKTNPFPVLPTPKAPHKNSWHDENGDDEYVSNQKYEAYEFEVTFYKKCFDAEDESSEVIMRKELNDFFDNIRDGYFMIYDSYTGIGRQNVRFAGFSEESFKRKSGTNGWSRAIFRIKFKVNDPITRIVMIDKKLVTE